jgi:hypothetical protein
MDIRVALTPDDRDTVAQFVERLTAIKSGRRRFQMTDAERLDYEISGKLVEVAVGRHFCWPVDWSIHPGGDGHGDFTLRDGSTLDCKGTHVRANMGHDYSLALPPDEVLADYYVQALVAPDSTFALITGGISRARFLALARPQTDWKGQTTPMLAVRRSQLSDAYPAAFYRATLVA